MESHPYSFLHGLCQINESDTLRRINHVLVLCSYSSIKHNIGELHDGDGDDLPLEINKVGHNDLIYFYYFKWISLLQYCSNSMNLND